MISQNNEPKKFQIDTRDSEAFCDQLKLLAKSYVPEWKFESENPDIGATLGILYSNMLSDQVTRINQTIDRYYTEFINMLDITPIPAIPAESIVEFSMEYETISGVRVPKHTKLVAGVNSSDMKEEEISDNSVVFETQEDVFVSGSVVDCIFYTDRENSNMTPILGQFTLPQIVNAEGGDAVLADQTIEESLSLLEKMNDEPEQENEDTTIIDCKKIKKFKLFEEGTGINRNYCLLYHPVIFDATNNSIFIKLDGGKKVADAIENKEFEFMYPVNGELVPCEVVKRISEDTFEIIKEKIADRQKVAERNCGLIALKSKEPISRAWIVDRISIYGNSSWEQAEFVGNDRLEQKVHNFQPFTDTLTLFNDCYIGNDDFFSKKGARISIKFDLYFDDHLERLTAAQVDAALKVIRKKARDDFDLNPAQVYAQQISIEYYNGYGWTPLPLEIDYSTLFADAMGQKVEISFICPADWNSAQIGSYKGKMLRFVLHKADNCFMRPAVHHYPIIKKLQMRYDYFEDECTPEILSLVNGTKQTFITNGLRTGEKIPLFEAREYTTDSLYLGFNKKPEDGPVGLFFQLSEFMRYNPLSIYYEYSSKNGFKRLRMLDETGELCYSGMVYFLPPTDFSPMTIEGNTRYYLRITRAKNQDVEQEQLPVIENIINNCVRVANIDTCELQYFYLEEIKPKTTFELGYTNLLDADVWVNEMSRLTMEEKKRMLAQDSDGCYAEYDLAGDMTSFFVLWKEVEKLDNTAPRRSYILDRHTSTLIFGDGKSTDIPLEINDIAVSVRCRRCLGRIGNVEENDINAAQDNLYFIGNIHNPIKAYGGSSTETIDEALTRGSNIIASRKRLVAKKDYINEINSFSDVIDQTAVVLNYTSEGKKQNGMIMFCLLMKDYSTGSYSFHRIVSDLKKHLLEKCELTIPQDELIIVEPIFVELSVTVWAESIELEDNFYLQNSLNEIMADYINPLKSQGGEWEIGHLPTVEQIRLRLSPLKKKMVIRNISVLVKYSDSDGEHEVSLEELKALPIMIAVNGKHYIK